MIVTENYINITHCVTDVSFLKLIQRIPKPMIN